MTDYDTPTISVHLNTARKNLKQAHNHAETWTEDMELTQQAVHNLGLQHDGRAGEDLPDRIIEAHAEAMASLTFSYAELVYEADDNEVTFFDASQREQFDTHLENAHDAAMTALRYTEETNP